MTVTISGLGGARPTNVGTTGAQNAVSTIGLPDGGYVVIWVSDEATYLMRRYDAAGAALGPDTPLGISALLAKTPEVALLPTGNLVIVFPSYYGIEAGVFTPSGQRLGSVPLPPSTAMSSNPSVVALSDGGYAIAWVVNEGRGASLQLQRYSADSVAVGEPVRVSATSSGALAAPTMATLADGGYILAWQAPAGGFGADINAQRYNSAGQAVGGVIRLNSVNADLREPDVIGLAGGGFVAVWQEYVMGQGYDILMRRFDASGVAVGGAVRANATAAGDQVDPSISRMADGGFVIAWNSHGENGGAYSRRFDSAGNPLADDVTLATGLTAPERSMPVVTGLTGGGYVVAWAGNDASGWGVYHSRIVTRVDNVLSQSVESAEGDGADDEFLAAPGVLSAGDRIDGAGGFDRIRMTSAGTLDFTGVTLSNVEQVVGSAGDDVIIFDTAPTGVALVGGGGVNTLMLGRNTDLGDLNLNGSWRVTGAAGSAVAFTVHSLDQLAMVDGAVASVTVEAAGLTLTAEQRASLFARGVDYVRDSNGILFSAEGWANLAPGASVATGAATALAGLANGTLATVSPQGVRVVNADGVAVSGLVSLSNGNLGAQDATIASLAGGGFVVAWIDPSSQFMGALRAQRFDASGAAIEAAFTVNGQTSGSRLWPDIAACPDGGFVVIWGGQNGQNSSFQRFDAAGVRAGPEVNVSDYGNGRLSVSALEDGRIVVSGDRYVGLYSAAGQPIGSPASLGDAARGGQVAALDGGGFVVVWTEQNTSGFKVSAQRFDDAGGRLGDPLILRSSFDAGSATSIAATGDGGFVIGWNIPGATSTSRVMVTQRFDADGARLGEPVTGSVYEGPLLTGLAGGGFATLWNTALGSGYTLTTVRPLDYHQLTPGVDLVSGGAGDTLVVAAAGAVGAGDVLRGGAGSDTFEMSGAGTLNLAAAVFEGFETLLGSSGNDTLILTGAQLAGLTRMDGRGGVNTLSFASSTGPVSMTVGQATGFAIVAGSTFADRLTGDSGANTLQGLNGDDILLGGAGNDVLMGGEGSDTADYSSAAAGVSARIDTRSATDGDGGTDTFVSIENLTGSAFDDFLVGDVGANSLSGGLGRDTITGGAGDDIISGGAGAGNELFGGQGDDTYVLDSLDTLVEHAGEGVDTVLLRGQHSYTLAQNVENATAVGTGAFAITGNALDNVLTGGAGDDVLRGGAGNDIIVGGAGIDVLEVSGSFNLHTLRIDGAGFVLKSIDGRDRLTGVEFIRFADGRMLDLLRLYDDAPLVLPGLADGGGPKDAEAPLVLPAVDGKFDGEPLVLPGEVFRLSRWTLPDDPRVVHGPMGPILLDIDLGQSGSDPWS